MSPSARETAVTPTEWQKNSGRIGFQRESHTQKKNTHTKHI